MTSNYEVTAVRYGVLHSRRSEQFHRFGVYDEPDGDIQMDFFFWVVRGPDRIILVDTGFDIDAVVHRTGRECLVSPMDAVARLGIRPSDVSTIVVTHFHFDHIGNVANFPDAEIVVQRREFDFWMGPHGAKTVVAQTVERRDLDALTSAGEQGRLVLIDGDAEIAPGVSVRLVGGHTPGQQIVIIDGEHPVVLASDTLHFYEEMNRDMPYSVFTDLPAMYDTYELLRELRRRDRAVIVAGHDPEVMQLFPAVTGLEGLAVRISPVASTREPLGPGADDVHSMINSENGDEQ